ncbi:hypothetical protein MVEN_00593000 [Mycena venus]|uniref:Uncharacterized protein n=1 Tax=Mycena venus TaxID=2733690 RepID=A0A8H7D4Y9_9AGAR|nr:hypothetical protein MVEN_00593000 [Mycena venus]
MHSSILPDQSKNASNLKSKGIKLHGHQGSLEVNLGAPFQILLDADSDVETPSPLTLTFDFPKPPLSPLRATTEWTDSDSDSDAEFEPEPFDDSQYITVFSDSPFYAPHPPPTFQTTFDIPPVPFAFQSSTAADDFSPESSVIQFRAELERILPSELKKDLFLIAEECLKGMDEELFSAPMDAFMDVCLSRLRPATSIPGRPPSADGPENSSKSGDASASLPKYYLASFLDLDRHDVTSLDPSLRELFCKRALSIGSRQASPAAARGITTFL